MVFRKDFGSSHDPGTSSKPVTIAKSVLFSIGRVFINTFASVRFSIHQNNASFPLESKITNYHFDTIFALFLNRRQIRTASWKVMPTNITNAPILQDLWLSEMLHFLVHIKNSEKHSMKAEKRQERTQLSKSRGPTTPLCSFMILSP